MNANMCKTKLAAFVAVLLIATIHQPVDAAILSVDAEVSTTAREILNGGPGSFTRDSAVLGVDGAEFPLDAISSLVSSDTEGTVISFGTATAELSDPALSTEQNPAEFGLEVAAFSNSDAIAYTMDGFARETRTVVFSSDSAIDPNPIAFNNDGTRVIESRLFLQGAMIAWQLDDSVSVSEMLGHMSVRVTRDDTGEVLFESQVEIDGGVFDSASANVLGPVEVITGGLELLEPGASEDVLAALRALDDAGHLVVVLLSFQEHTYRYTVSDGQALDLTATFEAQAANAPGGTGVAVAWGRGFEDLAPLIEQAIPGVNGPLVQFAINRAASQPAEPTMMGHPVRMIQSTGLCGVMGGGSLAFLAPLLLCFISRPRTHAKNPDIPRRCRGSDEIQQNERAA